jgi:hypothetical protein
MSKYRSLIMILLWCLCGLASCEPRSGRSARDYFPLAVGTRWTYATVIEGGENLRTLRVSVEREEKLEGQECAVMESFAEGSTESLVREYFTKTEDAVLAIKRSYPDGDVVLDPPEVVLKVPLQVGQQWEWKGIARASRTGKQSEAEKQNHEAGGNKTEYQFKVEKRETITAGDRQYDCFKVVLKGTDSTGERIESVRWFADGVGMVKEESSLMRGTKEQSMTAVLQSCEVAGKQK